MIHILDIPVFSICRRFTHRHIVKTLHSILIFVLVFNTGCAAFQPEPTPVPTPANTPKPAPAELAAVLKESGIQAYQAHQYEDAHSQFQSALGYTPLDIDLLERAARSTFVAESTRNQALDYSRQILAIEPNHGMARALLAWGDVYNANYVEAKVVLTELLNEAIRGQQLTGIVDPLPIVLNGLASVARFGESDSESAMQFYEQAIALAPNFQAVHQNIGNMHYINDEIADARAAYATLLAIDPQQDMHSLSNPDTYRATAHTYIGRMFDDEGSYEQALAEYDVAIVLNPLFEQAHFRRGRLLYREYQDYAGALDSLNLADEAGDWYLDMYTYRALARTQLYEEAGVTDYQKVVDDLIKARTRVENDEYTEYYPSYIYYLLGQSYAKQGEQPAAAIAALTQAYDLAPNETLQEMALAERVAVNKSREDYGAASADYTKLIALNPDSANLYYGRGGARLNAELYEGAAGDYLRVTQLAPSAPQAYYLLGYASDMYGNRSLARSAYAEFVSLSSGTESNADWLETAKGRVANFNSTNGVTYYQQAINAATASAQPVQKDNSGAWVGLAVLLGGLFVLSAMDGASSGSYNGGGYQSNQPSCPHSAPDGYGGCYSSGDWQTINLGK